MTRQATQSIRRWTALPLMIALLMVVGCGGSGDSGNSGGDNSNATGGDPNGVAGVDFSGLDANGYDASLLQRTRTMLKGLTRAVSGDAGPDFRKLFAEGERLRDNPGWVKNLEGDPDCSEVLDAWLLPGEPTEPLGYTAMQPPTREQLAEVIRAARDENDRTLEELHRLCTRPAHLPVNWDGDIDDLIAPDILGTFHIAKLALAIARLEYETGESGKNGQAAVRRLGEVFHVAGLMQQQRTMIGSVAGWAVEEQAQAQARIFVSLQRCTSDELRTLDEIIQKVEAARPKLSELIGGEYVAFTLMCDQVRSGKKKAPGSAAITASLMRAEAATGTRFYQRLLAIADLPFAQVKQKFAPIEKEITALPSSRNAYQPGVLTAMMLPAMESLAASYTRARASARATRVVIALERARLAGTARLPASLVELASGAGLGAADIVDPFDGKPLRYRSSGTTYRLYSVGDDLADNGGRWTESDPLDVVYWPVDAATR